MQIVRDQVGLHIENGKQVGDGFLEKADRRRVIQTADMLGQESLPALEHANRVLQVAAERQHGRSVDGQRNRHRHMAAGTANEGGTGAHHGIVATDDDVAVVHQEGVGDACQA